MHPHGWLSLAPNYNINIYRRLITELPIIILITFYLLFLCKKQAFNYFFAIFNIGKRELKDDSVKNKQKIFRMILLRKCEYEIMWKNEKIIIFVNEIKSDKTSLSALLARLASYKQINKKVELDSASGATNAERRSSKPYGRTDGYMQQWAHTTGRRAVTDGPPPAPEYAWAVTWPRLIRRRSRSVGPLSPKI